MDPVAYLITHFWPGGTEEQYRATLKVAHPAAGLPAGQLYHAAGPTDGGYLVAAVWDSRDAFDQFVRDTLMPGLAKAKGGFQGAPQERACEVANLVAV